ncbi:MAG: hypothetical protein ABR501_14030, partial [Pyrinomonadaceae bacterium]
PQIDPLRKYATIRARGIDYNPRFVRITLEQNGKTFVLTAEHFLSYSHNQVIVRLPQDVKSGEAKLIIENRGVDSYSSPVSQLFTLCCAP